MKKRLQTILFTAAVAVGGSLTVHAQAIEGYFRVQSALGTADDSHYVEVRGPFTTAPDLTKEKALTSAGTVMRLRAFPEKTKDGVRYKIANLSSQGIEVFGKPRADYLTAVVDLVEFLNRDDYEAAAYSLQRTAREIGYIASGRAIVEALFEVVAERLDNEVANLSQETKDRLGITADQELLKTFAQRFNATVSENLDLYAYLEPVKDNQYRLYFNWIDCTTASEFYLADEKNKKSFELGFECMRQYMNGKEGLASGERIDDAEAALWKEWGYDISIKYSDLYNEEGKYYDMSYEKIFADHEVLYNWLKMYIQRFLDPQKAPNATILGINFKEFAAEMQKHAIMQGFLKYIPSIQEGQKLYLTSGRFSDGVNEFSTVGEISDGEERFGLLGETQALKAGDAAIWNVLPIDETDNYFAIDPVGHREGKPNETDGHLLALYLDFPIEAVDKDNVKFMTIGKTMTVQNLTLENLGEVEYVEIAGELTEVPRLTPVLVETKTTNPVDNIVRIKFQTQDGDYEPTINDYQEPGFVVKDDEVAEQHSTRSGISVYAEGESALGYGVLLSTPATETALKNLWGIDADMTANSVYDLTTREDKKAAENGADMRTPWFSETATIPANHSFMIAAKGKPQQSISLGVPADEEKEVQTGVEEIKIENMETDVLYDLYGRKVTEAYRGGIYILNGKKILVR